MRLPLGVVGRGSIFVGVLVAAAVTPPELLPWVTAICLLLLLLAFRTPSLKRFLHPRRLLLLALLALPPLFLLDERSASFGPITYAPAGAASALQITLRFVVIIAAVESFTGTVEISELAGLFEAMGLKGLGFSLGVALNLLPALQQSSLNTWQALQMRGGFRRRRWRALGYLLMTIISGALRRAEEIALAAEARAFSPDGNHLRSFPVRPLDKWAVAGVVAVLALLVFLRSV